MSTLFIILNVVSAIGLIIMFILSFIKRRKNKQKNEKGEE